MCRGVHPEAADASETTNRQTTDMAKHLFSLSEAKFIKELMAGQNDNLHISYQDFVLQVVELCTTAKGKGYAISALLLAEVEISSIQTALLRDQVNYALVSFIDKALHFVRNTMANYKEIDFTVTPPDDTLEDIDLNWKSNKTDLVEIGYAFKVGKCFGDEHGAVELVQKLARLFKVEMTDNYIYKKFSEMRTRARNSRTYFLDSLGNDLSDYMESQDRKN